MYGGTGDDTYLFASGSGWDIIVENAGEGVEDYAHIVDILSVNLYRQWDNLLIAANGDSDVICLENWYTNQSVEYVYFAAADAWYDTATLAQMAYDITPMSSGNLMAMMAPIEEQAPAIDILGVPDGNTLDFAAA